MQKAMMDIHKDKEKDIIPIVISVLRRLGHEDAITHIYAELRQAGWTANDAADENTIEVPPVLPTTNTPQS